MNSVLWRIGMTDRLVALIYQASREETVVPVVPVGKITSDVSVFQEYGAEVAIEFENNDGN